MIHITLVQLLVMALLCHHSVLVVGLNHCKSDEITFAYAECDKDNGRWSFEVPNKPNHCVIENPKPPVWGKTCSFTCDAGHYMDLATQTCTSCPIGTYSLGNGVRFDVWDDFPEGFTSHSETITFAQYGYKTKANNCSLSLWKPNGHSAISNNDDCTSTMSYSVNLQQPGSVSFSYQYSDSDIIFHFFVQNSLCQLIQDKTNNVFLNTTGTEWKTFKVSLKEGPNVLNWQTTGIMINHKKKLNPVRIRNVEVTGVSHTIQCHKCRAGFIASEVASTSCKPCPIDTYSNIGSASCNPCDPATHFAPLASATCFKKPPCNVKDYFMTHSACDENKEMSVTYKWVEPKICLEALPGSMSLPPSGKKQPCAPCNPGFHPTSSECQPCPPNTYSNGIDECNPCPANTSPHYGYFYQWWNSLPRTMKSNCISLSNEGCISDKGWEPVGDKIETLSIHSDEAYLILVLSLNGFLSEIEENLFGQISFVFELHCSDECQFYFMEDRLDTETTLIEGWTGVHGEQTYKYDITSNKTDVSYTWAFKKMAEYDVARIFSINVTNALGSSADFCKPCAAGRSHDSKCIPCPTGSYLDLDSRKCIECTRNKIIAHNKISCVECGPGTVATTDHLKCASDCFYTSPITNRQYDFTNLSLPKAVSTVPIFTSSGKQYNHVYNISLCNNQGRGIAECIDNVTNAHSKMLLEGPMSRLKAMVCRSTAFPVLTAGIGKLSVHSQPTVVASYLLNVSDSTWTNASLDVFPKDSPLDDNDVFFQMRSQSSDLSNDCPSGRNTYIYLRCSPDVTESSGRIEMKSGCPDGTCNGCDFYFLWRSLAACPKCTKDDYKKVEGACQNGEIVTTYLWKRYPVKCHNGVSLPISTSKSCTEVMVYVQIGILCAIAVLLLTCALIFMLYKKNKKLEYKYHRLIVSGMGDKDDSEMPAADSCAISDSDSDFNENSDEVIFQKKKSRLFGKKKPNNYESVSLKPATTGV